LLLLSAILFFESCTPTKNVYLFSYFIGNGEDGLHFAFSHDGLTWEALNDGNSFLTPQIGKDRLMRDPSICQGPDGTFHIVWTTGWWDRIIGYASSKDLINWSDQKEIPVMMHEPEAKNSWAPELFYDRSTGLFFIFWASTIPGRHSDVAESERERGLNHRMYYTTTKDFKTFADTRIFFNPDFSVIDAAVAKWKGDYIMFLKNENPNPPEKNIRYTKSAIMGEDFPTVVSKPITGDYWAEGPSPLIIGGYLYVYFDKYVNRQYGAVRTTDGVTWEDVSEQIVFPKNARHGTAFSVNEQILEKLKTVQKPLAVKQEK
jgi:beta-galactosidase